MTENILVLGVGNILFKDEGVGIRVAHHLLAHYDFAPNVTVMDGGTLGMNLLGIMDGRDRIIVVDAVRNRGNPGDLYRIEGEDLPERIRAKNSLHQVDLLEALTLCQALGKVPETVIFGVEPADIETLTLDLSPEIEARIPDLAGLVIDELSRLGVPAVERVLEAAPDPMEFMKAQEP